MPLIQFQKKATEGTYLLMTKGAVTWLPGGVLGISEQLLQEVEPIFQDKGILMDLKLYLSELAQQRFGEHLVGVDFWGPMDGDDMMGEVILKTDLDVDHVLMRLHALHQKTKDNGWPVTLGWVVDNTETCQ